MAQNNNTTRYISADEIANGARAFNDAVVMNNTMSAGVATTRVGRTSNATHVKTATEISSRTPKDDVNASNTDQRPG